MPAAPPESSVDLLPQHRVVLRFCFTGGSRARHRQLPGCISCTEVMAMLNISAPDASAQLRGDAAHPGLTGLVRLYQQEGYVLVTAHVCGLPAGNAGGFFGFHIHEGTSCDGTGFPLTGSHFNPGGLPHPQHTGDLPPLLSCEGEAVMVVMTDRFTVDEVLGRTVVIHDHPDDFTTQPAGNSGTKIACGVIMACT